MQPHGAVAAQGGEEEALAAEDHGFQVARALDVVLHPGGHGHEAAGIDAEGFAFQVAADDGAAGVDKGEAVALQALEDEAFAAEQADADFFVESDADGGAERGAEEGVLFADDLAAEFRQIERDDLAGIGRGKGEFARLSAAVGEVRHEERLTGEDALADVFQRAEKAAAGS